MHTHKHLYTLIISAVVMLVITPTISCSTDESDDAGKIGVIVTLLPQAEFAEEIGGENVKITVMVPPGASPHTYEPTPGQMAAVAEAAMYAKVGSGVEFELVWLDKLIDQNESMLVVDCSKGIDLVEMNTSEDTHEAEHPQDNEHRHDGHDPHIWMSPKNAMVMAANICDGFVQIDPENSELYESKRDVYLNRLSELDSEIESGLADISNRTFMVYHPAFGYLAHDYDLVMLPLAEEGKEPTATGLANLIDQAKGHNIKVIFAEPQFDPQSAEVIADEIGATVILIDPLARDYIMNLQIITRELIEAMQ